MDDINREIREQREAHAKSLNYDVKAIIADFRAFQKNSSRPVVSFTPRPAERTRTVAKRALAK